MRPTSDQPTTNQTTNQATEQRVTVPEAATILGLSEDAVRSRLKRGTLAKEKRRDGTVFVVLGSDKTNDQPTTKGVQPATDQMTDNNQPTTGQLTEQSTLVEVLSDQVSFLRQQLNEEREANRENRRIIAGLVQRVPELEAAPELREAPKTVSDEGINPTAASPEPEQRRSWLYRFFFGTP
jgi:hypothetical protein